VLFASVPCVDTPTKGWRLNNIALMNKAFQSYGVSLAIWDHNHTVLPATRHKWTHPIITQPHRLVLD